MQLRKVQRFFINAPAIGVLVFSWCVCFFWIMMLSVPPWARSFGTSPVRPPMGYWQRTISDFFEFGIGAYLVPAVFVTASGLSYALAISRTRTVMSTSLVYGIINIIGLVALIAISIPVQQFIKVPGRLTPEEWQYWGDYRREWFKYLVLVVGFASLPIILQPHLAQWVTRVLSSARGETAKALSHKVLFASSLLIFLVLVALCGIAVFPPMFLF